MTIATIVKAIAKKVEVMVINRSNYILPNVPYFISSTFTTLISIAIYEIIAAILLIIKLTH